MKQIKTKKTDWKLSVWDAFKNMMIYKKFINKTLYGTKVKYVN